MDWITLTSIIVTIVGSTIGIYSIFSDKRKLKREKKETEKYLATRETLPIENWAKQKNIEKSFIELIKKLIIISKNAELQTDKDIDLIVNSNFKTEFIPLGISIWEINTLFSTQLKLDFIIERLNSYSNKINSSQTSFVFVTPFVIEQKELWKTKLANNKWSEIRIYDATDIARWLENEPSISIWFEIKHLGGFPSGGVVLPEDFWNEWATGITLQLKPNILLGGRDKEKNKVIESIKTPLILAVQSLSREESLAFILSSFIIDDIKKDSFFLKCFIVDSPSSFKQLIEKKDSLVLIPRFEELDILNLALQKGHSVIVPLGLEDSSNWGNKIILPPIERELFLKSLIDLGYTEETAKKLSKESARNITILRRQLEFTRTIPKWAKPDFVKDIIPLLLVGRWNEENEKDKELISEIAELNYDEYIFKLKKWLHSSDSPVLRIDNFWRLVSPLDAWTNSSNYISRSDLEKLGNSFLKVLSEKNPSFELKEKERLFSFEKRNQIYSSWVKEGLTQSLIIIAVFGNKLKYDLPTSPQIWVDNIIKNLLSNEDSLIWKSFEHYLPQIAEASPNSFLGAIEYHLSKPTSVIKDLFIEEEGFVSPNSYHTGLLWGLENVAWLPEFFSRATLLLAKLAAVDPGGKLSNRPMNSLVEIFKPWHYQTLTKFEDRIEVLKLICKSEKNIAWKLLCSMLPDSHSVGMPTHKMRWRLFDETLEKPPTYQEIWDTHSAIVNLLIENFDDNEENFAKLIQETATKTLSPDNRKKIIEFLKTRTSKINQKTFIAWSTLRVILSRHRSHPNTEWALKEDELKQLEALYIDLTPKDEIVRTLWLFDDHHPSMPQGFKYPDVPFEEQSKVIEETRIDALKKLYLKIGYEKTIELSDKVKLPWIYGDILAKIIDDEDVIIGLSEQLKNEKSKLSFIQSFFYRKSIIQGNDWIFKIFEKLKELSFTEISLTNLLLSIEQSQVIWDKLEKLDTKIQDNYWLNINPGFWGLQIESIEYGLKKLISYKRYYSAIEACSHSADKLSSNILVEILEKAATDEAMEDIRIDGYEISRIFEAIDKHNDTKRERLIQLEWYYLPVLASYGNERNPKILHDELASNPEFFIEILKYLYKSDNEEISNAEIKKLDESQIKNRAHQAYELLNSWKKIPGVNEKFEINKQVLSEWTNKARELAENCGRLDVADIHIGQILAQYPEESDTWPPEEICQIIEEINTDSLKSNFSSATFNKRGSSTRGAFDGGDIERGHAKYFETLANKIRNKYPIVAAILSRLAKGYLEDAKRMDKRAEIDKLDY